jgi:hypothetical protein
MRASHVALVIALAGLAPAPAFAQGRDAPAAEVLFAEGREAMDRRDYEVACKKFEESYRLDPASGTLLNLAKCEESLGKLASAWQHNKEVAEQLPSTDKRRAKLQKLIDELEPRVPRLIIKLSPEAPPDSTVKRDAIELGSASLGVALPVDPGDHVITVTAKGRADQTIPIRLAEGDRKEIVASPGPLLATGDRKKQKPAASSGPSGAGAAGADRAKLYLGITALAVGGASFAASMITGGLVLHRKGVVDEHCDDDQACDQAGLDAASSGSTLSIASTITFAVGIAGLGAGTVLLLTRDGGAPPKAALNVAAGPGAAYFSVQGRF